MMKVRLKLRAAPALVGVIVSVVTLAAGPALSDSRLYKLKDCATIDKPGSYVVTRNLKTDGDCLVVAADFVTIDLGGWVITGGGEGEGVTDQENSRQGITVRNGTVTGFRNAVSLFSTGEAVVEKVRAIGGEVGIGTGGDSLVSGNTADGTISIIAGPRSIVSGNFAFGRDAGLTAGPGSIVSGNIAEGTDVGIGVGGDSLVSGNTASEAEFGITAGPDGTVSGNTVSGGEFGIAAGPGSLVSGNTVGDAVTGIEVNCPSNVIGNTATGNDTNLSLQGDGCTNIDNLAP